jgi:hypothetical protein
VFPLTQAGTSRSSHERGTLASGCTRRAAAHVSGNSCVLLQPTAPHEGRIILCHGDSIPRIILVSLDTGPGCACACHELVEWRRHAVENVGSTSEVKRRDVPSGSQRRPRARARPLRPRQPGRSPGIARPDGAIPAFAPKPPIVVARRCRPSATARSSRAGRRAAGESGVSAFAHRVEVEGVTAAES